MTFPSDLEIARKALLKPLDDIAHELGIPVRFIGTGEKVDDLAPFDAVDFVDSLLA